MDAQVNKHQLQASISAVSGLNTVAAHSHSVQFYGEDDFLLDELSRYIGSALGAGDAAVVVATQDHRGELAARLRARGLDVVAAEAQGRYVSLDAAETMARFIVDGRPDKALFADVLGGTIAHAAASVATPNSRVAVFGEMVALTWAEGQPDLTVTLEQLWNDLAGAYQFDLRCAYPLHLFPGAGDDGPLDAICAQHTRVIPAENYSSLTDEDARLRAVLLLQQRAQALTTEIAERKKVQRALELREAELADFLENAVEGVQQVGPDQVVVWANAALLDLLGYEAGEYVGHPLGDFHASKEAFDEFWRRLMCREDIIDYPADLVCRDGSIKHVLINSNGLWEGGQFVHTRCFIRDVTEHKIMEEALRERNLELNRAVAARDEFLSVAAHELKTPITSLRGFAQLLLRDTRRGRQIAPERLAVALDVIEVQTGKLNQLLARLLDSAQIEAGKLRIEPVCTDLVALVQSVLAQYRGIGDDKVTYNGPGHLRAVVDPVRFEQVIMNLLDNALKYSPDGGGVEVGLEKCPDRSIRLWVTDHGLGIPPQQREVIFDRFHQAHGERHLSGMGIGLYVTREIVELHGGRIEIEDPEHQGSRFVVVLPPSASC